MTDISEYRFLLEGDLDAATLERSIALAARWGCAPHEVMIANGWIGERAYYRALASHCGAPFLERAAATELRPPWRNAGPRDCLKAGVLKRVKQGKSAIVVTPGRPRPGEVRNSLRQLLGQGREVAILPPSLLRETLRRWWAQAFLDRALNGLTKRFPEESARSKTTRSQRILLFTLACVVMVCGVIAPLATFRALAGMTTLFFCLVVILRLTACIHLATASPTQPLRRQSIPDADLPVYTILVPLFREHRILPDLVRALTRIDYPAAKLDIKLILESVDEQTLAAAHALRLPGNFDVIVVPDAQPRTKPKALNYALQFARGEFAVIYDAEDRPSPGQLREALAAFRTGPPNLACVQARLNFYNASENWLTRQFAIEYSALFDGYLPVLEKLGLPIPLGGTSNHFRMSALKWLGAWDAYNVTEDADLGMRLYRRGYTCKVLQSTTLEEATCSFMPWLRQRTRWMKGFMQTWLVHMRRPLRLWRELGTPRFLGFQVVIAGTVVSALVHPLFYVTLAVQVGSATNLAAPESLLGAQLWVLALFNVTLGYLASMAVALFALLGRNAGLIPQILFMPVYWLLASLAAYRAVVQLVRDPFYWEKTEHGLSSMVGRR